MDNSSVAGEEILTTEVFDFIRLSYLLDFAKLPLLGLLETEGEPLKSLLAREQKIIARLEKTRKIYQDESLILKQIQADTGPTDLNKLDIRLLCVLVRNIGNVRMPENGWIKKKLAADDTSEGADVLRIGDIRNDCHHLPSSARITKEKFDDIYPKLQKTLQRLVKGTQNEDYLRRLISDLDAPEFARRQCFLRSIKERAIFKWKRNTERENSLEASDQDVQQSKAAVYDPVKFKEAIFSNDVNVVHKLIGQQTQEHVEEGVRTACLRGFNNMFRVLTDKFPSLPLNHKLLTMACRGGSKVIVAQILEKLDPKSLESHSEDSAKLGRCCIHHAVILGHQDVVECLIAKIPRILMLMDKAGNTAMHLASMRGQTAVMETIYNTKVGQTQVGALNGKGLTPLHCAAYFGQLSAVGFLIQKGADKQANDKYGQSVLGWCEKGRDLTSLFTWYDTEFNLSPAVYGSPQDYESIIKIISD